MPPACAGTRGWGLRHHGLGARHGQLGNKPSGKHRHRSRGGFALFKKSSLLKYLPKLIEIPYRISLYVAKVVSVLCIYVQMSRGVFHSADPCNSREKQNICPGAAGELQHTALGLGTGRAWSRRTVLCVGIVFTPLTGRTQRPRNNLRHLGSPSHQSFKQKAFRNASWSVKHLSVQSL